MTIASVSARRRYLDRSSLISDRATCFIAFTMFPKPSIGLGFRHDGQDLNHLFDHIVIHPNIVADAKAVLGMSQPSKPLDPALARPGWLVPQMLLNAVSHRSAYVALELAQILGRFRGEQDFVAHSGYILARITNVDNRFGAPPFTVCQKHYYLPDAPRRLRPLSR